MTKPPSLPGLPPPQIIYVQQAPPRKRTSCLTWFVLIAIIFAVGSSIMTVRLASEAKAKQDETEAIAAEQAERDREAKLAKMTPQERAAFEKKEAEDIARLEREAEQAELEKQRKNNLSDSRFLGRNVKISNFKWEKGGFGSVMLATFTLTNNNEIAVKDIRMEFQRYAESGTPVGGDRYTQMSILKPGEKRTFKNVNLGFIHSQAERSTAEVRLAFPAE